jgi:2-dehydropantoate 2-reductase
VKVLVIGAGAVGSLLGWALAAAGHEVTLLRRHHEPGAEADELVIVRPDGSRAVAPATIVADPAQVATPELLVTAVKMYDLATALASCQRWPETPLLAVENGVGAEEIVSDARPGAGLVAGSLTAAVERAPSGDVHWLRRGGLGLARVRGEVGPLIAELVAAFAAQGLPARRYRDAASMKWSKLASNLVANATSAILDEDPAVIYADPQLFDIERRQLREAFAVMRCLGLQPVALPGANVRLLALAVALPSIVSRLALGRVVAGARGGKSPSLRAHVAGSGGPSEVGWLNGAVVAAGARCGMAVPVNQVLTRLVDEVATDPDRRAWFRGRGDRLRAAIEGVAALAPVSPPPQGRDG